MYRICRLVVSKLSGKAIYSQCYDFDYKRLQTAKDKLKELSGVDARDILPCLKATPDVFKRFCNAFCDGHAEIAFWTMGSAENVSIRHETAECYSEWFIYTTDRQRYLYEQPVTDLRRYRALEEAHRRMGDTSRKEREDEET